MAVLPFDILVITDRVACEQVGRTVEGVMAQLLASPLSNRVAVLVRDKFMPQAQVAQTLQTLQPLIQAAGARLLVHSHFNLALEFGLAGVHVASHIHLASARTQLGPGMILGASRHRQDGLGAADIGWADYATISPIYPPTSKPDDTRPPLMLSGLKACLQRSTRPLVALGGMRSGRVAGAISLGASAIAISGALLQAHNPTTLLQDLCAEIDRARGQSSHLNVD